MQDPERGNWRPGAAEHLRYYVYLLIDPRNEKPFYVGKGTGDRCFSHIREAGRTTRDTRGDYIKLDTIREIEDGGEQVLIEVLRHGLDEPTAFVVESAAIDLLGMPSLTNRVEGHGADTLGGWASTMSTRSTAPGPQYSIGCIAQC